MKEAKGPFIEQGIEILPLEIKHKEWDILGYKINNFAYITDCSFISDDTLEKINGVDLLVIDALRYFKHDAHLSVDEAVVISNKVGAKRTILTHMGSDLKYGELIDYLPKGIEPDEVLLENAISLGLIMHELRSNLTKNKKAKIGLFVLDGVGGLPFPKLTELEAAKTPTLDKLAKKSETGAHIPILSGLTPGSGSAHLSLFGYDPLKYNIGRGILEGLGLDISVNEKDLLIRGNFSTVIEKNSKLIITDRRAGRISTAHNKRIVKLLQSKITKIDGIQVEFTSGLEHRFVCKLKFNHKLRLVFYTIFNIYNCSSSFEPTEPKQRVT